MKALGKLALFAVGVGLLGVAVSSIPNRALSALQPPQSTPGNVKIVTLVCGRFVNNICTDLERVAPDGTLTSYTEPPSGFVLVVTDFTWKAASVPPGQVAFATLHHELTSPPHDVAFSTAVATSDAAAVAESHFSTGVVFGDLPIVFVSHRPDVVILQGNFMPQ
jgi:hypothetical protein